MAGAGYLFLLPELASGHGGIRRYGIDLVRAVAATGARCVVVALNDAERDNSSKLGSDVVVHPCATGGPRVLQKIMFGLTAFRCTLAERPRLVVCGHVHFLLIVLLVKLLLRRPYVVLTYGIDVWGRRDWLLGAGLRAAQAVWTISRFTKRRMLDGIPVPEERIALLPNMVDSAIFDIGPRPIHLVERYGLAGKRVALTVGRLNTSERDKGFEVVLQALAWLRGGFPDLRYVVVGDGAYRSELEQYAVRLGVSDLVSFAGFVADADLPDYYRLCDVFVMPSKKEGFGFVFLEALACGKPVIAGDRDGARDALLDGLVGQLVDPDDPEQVGLAIRRVIDRQLPSRLLDPSFLRRTVTEHYGPDRFAERVARLMEA